MRAVLIVLAALTLDALLGEPRRLHPLAGFGRWALAVERRCHGDAVWRGVFAVLIVLIPFTLLAALTRYVPFGVLLDTLLLYLAIGWRSLGEHAARVRDSLRAGDLVMARTRVGLMVSRDTASMQAGDIAKATVESVLENGNDAIFGAIFWFMVAGAPGAVAYRLANTLDALWGYRNARYRRFGWAAARLDDVLNYIPARLTALSYALVGRTRAAWRCWRTQGAQWKSPNAGPVMAAGAGSLGVLLGGAASYHGAMQERPPLGEGGVSNADTIDAAVQLIRNSVAVWLITLSGGALLVDAFLSR